MTMNEAEGFRKMLTARIAELERIIRQRDGIAIERSADLLEEVQCASERALAVSNLDRDCSQLRNARAALGRIQDDSFGTCLRCGAVGGILHPVPGSRRSGHFGV